VTRTLLSPFSHYDLDFTDAITEDWGGRPFEDLIAGWKYVLEKFPEVNAPSVLQLISNLIHSQIDPERTVAAGASYGGFAIK